VFAIAVAVSEERTPDPLRDSKDPEVLLELWLAVCDETEPDNDAVGAKVAAASRTVADEDMVD
jgi:hypothetical protein